VARVLVFGDHRFQPVVVIQEHRFGQRTIAASVIFQEQRQGRSGHRPKVGRVLPLGLEQPAPVGRRHRVGKTHSFLHCLSLNSIGGCVKWCYDRTAMKEESK